ncbi:MAG: hypothetical protein QM579_07285 [Desulfovibrio sp.]|uniref:hypothetical protein n=1 Tax=Desulfovibrio sp. TaxID=885 RepID=UPI0039E597C2
MNAAEDRLWGGMALLRRGNFQDVLVDIRERRRILPSALADAVFYSGNQKI